MKNWSKRTKIIIAVVILLILIGITIAVVRSKKKKKELAESAKPVDQVPVKKQESKPAGTPANQTPKPGATNGTPEKRNVTPNPNQKTNPVPSTSKPNMTVEKGPASGSNTTTETPPAGPEVKKSPLEELPEN